MPRKNGSRRGLLKFSRDESVNEAYTFREKAGIAAGAVTSLVIIGWIVVIYLALLS